MSCNSKKAVEKVLLTSKKYRLIENGDRILVAFSGGPDSVFLLTMLNELRKILNIELAVAHFHHGIRGIEADRDLEFSKDFAHSMNLLFFEGFGKTKEYAQEHHLSIEEAARILRYKFLEKTLSKWNGTKIATAHTLSDSVETVLFNLFRGTGPTGLAGILPKRDKIIRPIIGFTREEILSYLEECEIPYIIDSTNLSIDYTRNYIRHVIVPAIRKKFPTFEENIGKLSDIFKLEKPYFEEKSKEIYEKSFKFQLSNIRVLDIEIIKKYHTLELSWFFRLALDIEFLHILQIIELLKKAQGRLRLPGHKLVWKSFHELAVIEGELPHLEEVTFTPPFELKNEYTNVNITAEIVESANKTDNPFVFYWHIPELEFEIGPRKPGDRVKIPGVGQKKLKDLFIEKKIPAWRRDLLPVVRQGGKILWVPLVYKHHFENSDIFVKLEVKKIEPKKGWIFNK